MLVKRLSILLKILIPEGSDAVIDLETLTIALSLREIYN